MLTKCCCCIPLKYGCYAIGIYYIISNLYTISYIYKIFKVLGPDENEDEENTKQRKDAQLRYGFKAFVCVVSLAFSICTVVSTWKPWPLGLKVCAVYVGGASFIPFILQLITGGVNLAALLSNFSGIALAAYFAIVLWSYADLLLDGTSGTSLSLRVFVTPPPQHVPPSESSAPPYPYPQLPPSAPPYPYPQQPASAPYMPPYSALPSPYPPSPYAPPSIESEVRRRQPDQPSDTGPVTISPRSPFTVLFPKLLSK